MSKFSDGIGLLGDLVGRTDFWNMIRDGSSSSLGRVFDDLTGLTNTKVQNSAAAALQEDAQAFNASESAAQREFEAQEAQKNRDWQTEMSNTAVQRQMADYKAAGLNPILAAGNGASTPSAVSVVGSAASSGTASAQASNVSMLQSLGTTAVGLAMLIKALKYAK